jgi:hypothetical protein
MRAYCYRSGQIVFGQRLPKGTMPIAQAKAKLLRDAVSGLARMAYDGKTLLVPGLPEAGDDWKAASAALTQFTERVAGALVWRSA